MKTELPEGLIQNVPQTHWGKILLATPVVMTVVATLLAGLASSEMTKAQYDRALGAQLQSKAGDQWSYFQAKKLRGVMQRNSYDLLTATAEFPDPGLAVPKVPIPVILQTDPKIQSALRALEVQKPEAEIAELLKPIEESSLAAALQSARDNALAFDQEVAGSMKQLEETVKVDATAKFSLRRSTAAKMQFGAARYEAEARLNQTIASIYELQVRKINVSAERRHRRSGKFFYGMLSAQAAVIVSTFAIAAQKRNFLWSVAALAGIAAIVFAIYVYLRV